MPEQPLLKYQPLQSPLPTSPAVEHAVNSTTIITNTGRVIVPKKPTEEQTHAPFQDIQAHPSYESVHPAAANNKSREVKVPVVIPGPEPVEFRYEELQQWECTVVSIIGAEFIATLEDLTNPLMPDEEATFLSNDVPDSDQSLLSVGSVFYWTLGYKVGLGGQKERISSIRFRRLPRWTKGDLQYISNLADSLGKDFGSVQDHERGSRAK